MVPKRLSIPLLMNVGVRWLLILLIHFFTPSVDPVLVGEYVWHVCGVFLSVRRLRGELDDLGMQTRGRTIGG
jgi:hypothetical protein